MRKKDTSKIAFQLECIRNNLKIHLDFLLIILFPILGYLESHTESITATKTCSFKCVLRTVAKKQIR